MKTASKLLFPNDDFVIKKAGSKYSPEEWYDILVSAWILHKETGEPVKLSIKKSFPRRQRRLLGREFRRKQQIIDINESRAERESNETLHRAVAQLEKEDREVINDHFFLNRTVGRRKLDGVIRKLRKIMGNTKEIVI